MPMARKPTVAPTRSRVTPAARGPSISATRSMFAIAALIVAKASVLSPAQRVGTQSFSTATEETSAPSASSTPHAIMATRMGHQADATSDMTSTTTAPMTPAA